MSMKYKILLYSCGKLCYYSNQIISCPHKLIFWMYFADMIIEKGVPFPFPTG